MIRLSQASLGEEEQLAAKRVLQDGYLGMGNEVKCFEEELRQFFSNETNVVCVNTGTSALHLAVQACGIKTGDEVIVPSLTYVASFQAVSATGAKPIACDIDPATGCIDIASASNCITSRTKAIMPVHYASNMGDLESVYNLGRKNGLRIIADAAHSFGGRYKNELIGIPGDITCFSFDGIKNITCGEGGAVVSKDREIISKIQDLRLLGVEKDTEKRYSAQRSWDFQVLEQGWRYHMSNMNAAIGREQLKKIQYFGEVRRAFAQLYKANLEAAPVKIVLQDFSTSVPHIFPILISEKSRDSLKDLLLTHGIETGVHYKPNHLHEKFKGQSCPEAEQFWRQTLTLPLHCNLLEDDVVRITDIIKKFFKESPATT